MKIYLVRHGQTVENIKKITMGQKHGVLTPLGIRQAQLVGKKLKNKINIAYSSDLKRAKDTFKEIKKYLPKTPVIYAKDIRETRFGELEGKRWDRVSMKDINGNFMTKKARGGESLYEVKKRVGNFINTLKEKHSNDQVLIVTHGGIIKIFLSIIKKIPTEQIFNSIQIENASICKLEITLYKTKVFYINKTDHLKIKE